MQKNNVKPIIFRPKFDIGEKVLVVDKDYCVNVGTIEKRKFIDYGENDIDFTDKRSMDAYEARIILIEGSLIRNTKIVYTISVYDYTVKRDESQVWKNAEDCLKDMKKLHLKK